MQPRTTAVLLVVALALGAFVYFYEIRGGEARKEAEERAKRLFSEVDVDAVQAIWFRTTDEQEVRLERDEEGWRIVAPLRFAADDVTVDGLARSLAELASEAVIDEPQAPEVYGLEPDRAVGFRADGRDYELHLGKKTPIGGNTYAVPGGLDAGTPVYAVPSHRVSGFQKSLKDLRESRLLHFEPETIGRVEARWPGGSVVLARQGVEDWSLVEPQEGAADATTVDTLLSDLRFLRAEGFVDEPGEQARAALAEPAFEVRLETRAGEGEDPEILELRVGGGLRGGTPGRGRGGGGPLPDCREPPGGLSPQAGGLPLQGAGPLLRPRRPEARAGLPGRGRESRRGGGDRRRTGRAGLELEARAPAAGQGLASGLGAQPTEGDRHRGRVPGAAGPGRGGALTAEDHPAGLREGRGGG